MNRAEILEQIIHDIEDNLFHLEQPPTEDTNFREDLGMDSLDFIEMVMGVEEVFGFDVLDKDAERWETMRDAIDFVEGCLS